MEIDTTAYWAESVLASLTHLSRSKSGALSALRVAAGALPYLEAEQAEEVARSLLVQFEQTVSSQELAWEPAMLAGDENERSPSPSVPLAVETVRRTKFIAEYAKDTYQAATEFAPPVDSRPAAMPPRGVPGVLRGVVEVPDREERSRSYFLVSDLVALTSLSAARPSSRLDLLRAYASSAVYVDHCVEIVSEQVRLPSDDRSSRVLAHLCLTRRPFSVGLPGEDRGGRSLDLAATIAALGHRFGWELHHDRVVASGRLDIDPDGQINVFAVGALDSKLEAILDWARKLHASEAGRFCLVLIPRRRGADERRRAELTEKLAVLGVVVVEVGTLREAISALPIVSATTPVATFQQAARWWTLAIYFLFAERFFYGDILTDPESRRIATVPGLVLAAAVAVVQGLAPAYVVRRVFAGAFERPVSLLRLFLACAAACHAAYLFSFVAGMILLPAESPTLEHKLRGIRLFNIWKDTALLGVLMFVLLWGMRATASTIRAAAARRSGQLFDVPALRVAAAGAREAIPGLLLLAIGEATWLLASLSHPFVALWEKGNHLICVHIGFQILGPPILTLAIWWWLRTTAERERVRFA